MRKDQIGDLDPILMKVLNTNLMGSHIVGTESLHTEVVDEAISLEVLNI